MSASPFNFQTAQMDTDGRNDSWLTDWQKTFWPPSKTPAYPGLMFEKYYKDASARRNSASFTAQQMPYNPFMFIPYNGFQPMANHVPESNINYGFEWTHSSQFPSPIINAGTSVQFRPTILDEVNSRNGVAKDTRVQYQSITAMPEYRNKSPEELRLEDYVLGRTYCKLNECKTTQYNEPALLDVLLQNVIRGPSQNINVVEDSKVDSADGVFGKTSFLLHALLNNIKQRFSLNDLSEEARRTCEKLTLKLMDYTEKTLENLTVVVLEDLLNNVKQRKNLDSINTASETAKPEKSLSCCCKPKESKKNQRETKAESAEKTSIGGRKKPTKIVSYCSSEYDEDSEFHQNERCGLGYKSAEHRCDSVRASKLVKKPPSDDRHEPKRYTGRDRRHSPHLILRYKKRATKRCDAGGHKCCARNEVCSSRVAETSYERKKNLPPKKQPTRNGKDELDECHICEHLKMVSVTDARRECAAVSSELKKEKSVHLKQSVIDDYDVYEEERDGGDHELSDRSVEDADGAGQKCDVEEKLESDNPEADFSDSSSI